MRSVVHRLSRRAGGADWESRPKGRKIFRNMASVSEILKAEQAKEQNTVILFAEGLFYRAYEHSAHELATKFGFKPSKKFVKIAGQYVVSVGFPKTALEKYASNAAEVDGNVLVAPFRCSAEGFDEWKNSIGIAGGGNTAAASNSKESSEILDEIRAFSLETSTPLECMLFLSELKKKANASKIR